MVNFSVSNVVENMDGLENTAFEIPCLTEEPTKRKSKNGIIVSIVTLFLLSLSYALYGLINDYATFYFFGIATFLMLSYSFYMIRLFSGNIIIIFRFLLLLVPIFITSYVWWLYRGHIYTAFFGFEFQTLKATYIIVMGGFLSVIGSAAGWFAGMLYFKSVNTTAEKKKNFYDHLNSRYKKILILGLSGSIFFGLAYYIVSGGSVYSTGGYATGVGHINILFGVYNVFQMFFTSLVLIAISLKKKKYALAFFILIFSYVLGVLTGSRADYLLPVLFLIIIYIDGNLLNKFYVNTKSIIRKRYLKLFILVFLGFFVSTAIGFWRNDIKLDLFSIILKYLTHISSVLFLKLNYHKVFFMGGTANEMIGGFYGIVQRIHLGYSNFYYGMDYLNYIPRLLPAFIRPESFNKLGLAYHTNINGVIMSQGGIFEPAEAYVNFGFLGCFFISFLISFFFVWLLKKAKKNFSIFFMSWYIVNGFMLSRAVWYQNFAFARIMSVMLFLYVIFYLLKNRWFFGINPIFKKYKA